jgi:hypothetical protein
MPQRRVILQELEHRVRVWPIDLDLRTDGKQKLQKATTGSVHVGHLFQVASAVTIARLQSRESSMLHHVGLQTYLVEDRECGVELLFCKVLDFAAAAGLLFAKSIARKGQLQRESTMVSLVSDVMTHKTTLRKL